jgi:hypothetical protein
MARKTVGKGKRPPVPAAFSPKNSHTSGKQIAIRRKIAAALDLRTTGYTYQQIAVKLKVSVTRAHEMVVQGMTEIVKEPAQAALDLELKRLDTMLAAIMSDASTGDQNAMNMVLRIMDRRARYLGLDKTQEKAGEVGAPGGLDITINFVAPDGTKLIDAEYERARAIRAAREAEATAAVGSNTRHLPPPRDEEGEV